MSILINPKGLLMPLGNPFFYPNPSPQATTDFLSIIIDKLAFSKILYK